MSSPPASSEGNDEAEFIIITFFARIKQTNGPRFSEPEGYEIRIRSWLTEETKIYIIQCTLFEVAKKVFRICLARVLGPASLGGGFCLVSPPDCLMA